MESMFLLEKQEGGLRSSSRSSLDFPHPINNEGFLLIMDEINIRISYLIENKKHKTILNIFFYYLHTELYLIRHINRSKGRKIHNYNQRKYRELLELQNYYNNFRILLISQIAEHLTKIFNKLQKMTETDLLKSLRYFKYYEKVLNFYIENIRHHMHSEYKKISDVSSEKLIQYNKALKVFLELNQLFSTIPKSKKALFALLTI